MSLLVLDYQQTKKNNLENILPLLQQNQRNLRSAGHEKILKRQRILWSTPTFDNENAESI